MREHRARDLRGIGNSACPTGRLDSGPVLVQREGDASEKGSLLASLDMFHSTTYQVVEADASPAPGLLAPPAGQTWRKYYYANGQRVAMQVLTSTFSTLYFLSSDHLGSTSLATSNSGAVVAQVKYKAFGEIRSSTGTLPTDYKFTGQRQESLTGGLYDYGARYYDVTRPQNVALLDFPSNDYILKVLGLMNTSRSITGISANTVNVYNVFDPFNHDIAGAVQGALNVELQIVPSLNDPQYKFHTFAVYSSEIANRALNVYFGQPPSPFLP